MKIKFTQEQVARYREEFPGTGNMVTDCLGIEIADRLNRHIDGSYSLPASAEDCREEYAYWCSQNRHRRDPYHAPRHSPGRWIMDDYGFVTRVDLVA